MSKYIEDDLGFNIIKEDESFYIIGGEEIVSKNSLFLNKDGYLILSLPKEFINIEIPGVSLISFKKYSEANILIYKKLS